MANLKNNYIVQAWLVLILAFCFGGSLTGMQLTLAPRIEANKINETLQQVPALVLGTEKAEKLEAAGQALEIESMTVAAYNVFKAVENGKLVGWVTKTKGQGYADKIELLVGLNPQAKKITGLFIIDQKETPGLGDKISTDKWRAQFYGKTTETPLVAVKTGAKKKTDIDAIAGATISSRAVCDIVNKAVKDLKSPLTDNL